MSASREKKQRQTLSPGYQDPKAVLEEKKRRSEKRFTRWFAVGAVVIALLIASTLVRQTGLLSRLVPAVTIDGESYTAAEVSCYVQAVYRSFLTDNAYAANSLGLDTAMPLASQPIAEENLELLEMESGSTWLDYFIKMTINQMVEIQATLEKAEAENYVWSDTLQLQYNDFVDTLHSTAAAAGVSVNKYLKSMMGNTITEKIYTEQMLRAYQYTEYITNIQDANTYTEADLEAAYREDPTSYDHVAYEMLSIPATGEYSVDENGNTVAPSEEANAAAREKALELADEFTKKFENGTALEDMADEEAGITFGDSDALPYYGDLVTEWLFDSSRKVGELGIIESDYYIYLGRLLDRFRKETPTVDIRQILISAPKETLPENLYGYMEEQDARDAQILAEAEALYEQWKNGEATEESFAALAQEHSSDSAKYNGGLYSTVMPGGMGSELEQWCFDASRKTGDTDIITSDMGVHIVYFVGENIPYWQAAVTNALRNQDYADWIGKLIQNIPVEKNIGLKLVG